jgi:hypothetical protein
LEKSLKAGSRFPGDSEEQQAATDFVKAHQLGGETLAIFASITATPPEAARGFLCLGSSRATSSGAYVMIEYRCYDRVPR